MKAAVLLANLRRPSRRTTILWGVLSIIIIIRLTTIGAYPILDPTESRYALIGKLMLGSGNWITPFLDNDVPFLGKPPLSIWAIALSYAIFGVNPFAARFPSFVAWVFSITLVFAMGAHDRENRERDFALIASCIFASTSLGFYLGGAAMTDPALLLGITLTMVAFYKRMRGAGLLWGYLFFVGIALSVLAKGLIGAVLPAFALGAWIVWHRKWKDVWRKLPWTTGTILALVLVLPWFVLAERETPGFLRYFFLEEHFKRFLVRDWRGLYGHSRRSPYGIIWLFGFIASLPWSAVFAAMLFKPRLRNVIIDRALINDEWLSYLVFWSLAPLIFFTASSAVLIPYAAPGLPAFALLAAHIQHSVQWPDRRVLTMLLTVPIVFLTCVAATWVRPGSWLIATQARIAEAFKASAPADNSELYYIFDRPSSAQFYLAERAKLAAGADEVIAILKKSAGVYFAVATRHYARLPAELRQKFKTIAEQNGTLLLEPKS